MSRPPERIGVDRDCLHTMVRVGEPSFTVVPDKGQLEQQLEQHRSELTALLLPHARLPVRGRGRRAGDLHPRVAGPRPLRGPLGAALLALPDRDERLPRHARRPRAPRAADGPRAGARAPRPDRRDPPRGDLARAGARRPRRARRRRPRRGGGRARDHPPRLRRRAAAPAAAPARRADPLRGAALEGRRGRRAARDERRLGQQRAAARAGDARRERRQLADAAPRSTSPTASCSPATSTPSSATTWRR